MTKAVDVTINPPSLLSLTLSPAAVLGNLSTTGNKITLNGPAPTGGITAAITSADPVNAIVPPVVTVPEGATVSPVFTIDTKPVAAQTVIAITASQGAVTKSANLTLNPIIVQTVTLSPATIASGLSTTANKIVLNGAAPAGDAVVALSTDSPTLVSLPPTITVLAGQTTSAAFTISTNWTATQKVAKIIATYNNVPKSSNLTINPTSLTTLTLSPTTVIGNVDTTANVVKLDSPAPTGGAAVSLTSSNSLAATVPPTVTVAEGQTTSAPFTIHTLPVSSETPRHDHGDVRGAASRDPDGEADSDYGTDAFSDDGGRRPPDHGQQGRDQFACSCWWYGDRAVERQRHRHDRASQHYIAGRTDGVPRIYHQYQLSGLFDRCADHGDAERPGEDCQPDGVGGPNHRSAVSGPCGGTRGVDRGICRAT